jgi:hypothetical protein
LCSAPDPGREQRGKHPYNRQHVGGQHTYDNPSLVGVELSAWLSLGSYARPKWGKSSSCGMRISSIIRLTCSTYFLTGPLLSRSQHREMLLHRGFHLIHFSRNTHRLPPADCWSHGYHATDCRWVFLYSLTDYIPIPTLVS